MPHFLKSGTQHCTLEANESRIVTKIRWIVESVNGIIKRWKHFKHDLLNTNIPYIQDDFRIVCALINKYRPNRCQLSNENDEQIAAQMINLLKKENVLINLINKLPNDTKRMHKDRLVNNINDIDFPILQRNI